MRKIFIYEPARCCSTGLCGVGKTSTACTTAVTHAELGKKVLLISIDPASNLQDAFNTCLDSNGTEDTNINDIDSCFGR